MKKNTIALCSGLLFGTGLTISQMVNPEKILNFLMITTKQWDASLILVMLGALMVFGVGQRLWLMKRNTPIWASTFSLPEKINVDGRLIVGAILFGIGWGLGGLCPGPALANILSGNVKIFAFIGVMTIGMWIGKKI